MEALALVGSVAKFALLLAGLLLPGAALMRALRVPTTLATSFAGSAVAIYATVLALQLASIPISLASLSAGLALFTGTSWFFGRDARPARPQAADTAHEHPNGQAGRPALPFLGLLTRFGPWTPLYLLFWAATLVRLLHEPLAGADLEFRWSFLAEQMLRLGTLDFYPPRSTADFTHYFWLESIPPGASALHAWAFACAGRASLLWAAPAVLLQLWAIHELLWHTAERSGGQRAARYACLAAAACPLLTWSVLLGQETGLTALSLTGVAFALQARCHFRTAGWAALVGIFATLGAAAREYGLVFPVLAAAGLALQRADCRAWLAFLATAVLSLLWPLRTTLLTGNPFYSLATLSVFPTNARFLAWIEHDAAALGTVLQTAQGWRDTGRYLVLFGLPALVGWAALIRFSRQRSRAMAWMLGSSLVILGLWAASVRYTNGGLFYSLRLASPALALGALAAGIGLAYVTERRARFARWAPGALGGILVFSLAGVLALPRNPWRAPIRDWPAFAPRPTPPEPDDTLALILRHADPATGAALGPVLTDAPGFQRRVRPADVRAVPPWSPQADALFDGTLLPAEAARRWRATGIRYLVLSKWQANIDFFNARSRWAQPPFQTQLVGETPQTAVFLIKVTD